MLLFGRQNSTLKKGLSVYILEHWADKWDTSWVKKYCFSCYSP